MLRCNFVTNCPINKSIFLTLNLTISVFCSPLLTGLSPNLLTAPEFHKFPHLTEQRPQGGILKPSPGLIIKFHPPHTPLHPQFMRGNRYGDNGLSPSPREAGAAWAC